MKILKSLYGHDIILDDEDYTYYSQWNWGINSSGYARRTAYDKLTKIQRTLLMHKDITKTNKTQTVDHINGNKLDNRKENLRVTTNSNNAQRIKRRRLVHFDLDNLVGIEQGPGLKKRPYFVRINKDKKRFSFGCFSTKQEAADVYDLAAAYFYDDKALLHGEYSKLTKSELLSKLIQLTKNRLLSNELCTRVRSSIHKQIEYLTSLQEKA